MFSCRKSRCVIFVLSTILFILFIKKTVTSMVCAHHNIFKLQFLTCVFSIISALTLMQQKLAYFFSYVDTEKGYKEHV